MTRSVFRPWISCGQPWPSTPTSRSRPTAQSVKNTSLTSRPIVEIGLTSIPGAEVGTEIIEMPWCLWPVSAVRATSRM